MRKLFKHLKPYAATIAAIVVILIVQAYCDLSLPSYTSDIVNVGIQQGGIDEKIPDAIAEEEMNKLLLFVAEEDQQTVLDAYEKKESDSDYKYDGAIYVLKDSVKKDEEKSGKVFDILGKPMLLTYGFESGSDTTKKMEESMKENMISSIKEQAEKQAESMQSQMTDEQKAALAANPELAKNLLLDLAALDLVQLRRNDNRLISICHDPVIHRYIIFSRCMPDINQKQYCL